MSGPVQREFHAWVAMKGVSLTPAQRDLADAVIRAIVRSPELKQFVKARRTGVTMLFKLLEEFLKGL